MQYYSQFGEDKWIDGHLVLPTEGVYADIGCAHPVMNSNTAFLRERGWVGVHVDGDPHWTMEWKSRGLEMLNAPVGLGKDAYYRCDPNHEASRLAGPGDELQSAAIQRVVNLEYVLGLNPLTAAEIDFLSLDVEGNEMAVLSSMDFRKHLPKVIVLEYNTFNTLRFDAVNFVRCQTDYDVVLVTECNYVFAHASVGRKVF
jgi:hypothetical protein